VTLRTSPHTNMQRVLGDNVKDRGRVGRTGTFRGVREKPAADARLFLAQEEPNA